jgi:selenocysteine lyase/cysteine desulfurase
VLSQPAPAILDMRRIAERNCKSLPLNLAASGVVFTLGRFNTPEEVDRLLEILPRAVASLRSIHGLARSA